jgi:hypothetical protein
MPCRLITEEIIAVIDTTKKRRVSKMAFLRPSFFWLCRYLLLTTNS